MRGPGSLTKVNRRAPGTIKDGWWCQQKLNQDDLEEKWQLLVFRYLRGRTCVTDCPSLLSSNDDHKVKDSSTLCLRLSLSHTTYLHEGGQRSHSRVHGCWAVWPKACGRPTSYLCLHIFGAGDFHVAANTDTLDQLIFKYTLLYLLNVKHTEMNTARRQSPTVLHWSQFEELQLPGLLKSPTTLPSCCLQRDQGSVTHW